MEKMKYKIIVLFIVLAFITISISASKDKQQTFDIYKNKSNVFIINRLVNFSLFNKNESIEHFMFNYSEIINKFFEINGIKSRNIRNIEDEKLLIIIALRSFDEFKYIDQSILINIPHSDMDYIKKLTDKIKISISFKDSFMGLYWSDVDLILLNSFENGINDFKKTNYDNILYLLISEYSHKIIYENMKNNDQKESYYKIMPIFDECITIFYSQFLPFTSERGIIKNYNKIKPNFAINYKNLDNFFKCISKNKNFSKNYSKINSLYDILYINIFDRISFLPYNTSFFYYIFKVYGVVGIINYINFMYNEKYCSNEEIIKKAFKKDMKTFADEWQKYTDELYCDN